METTFDATAGTQPAGDPLSPAVTVAVMDAVSDLVDVVAGMDRAVAVMMGLRAEAMGQAILSSAWGEADPSSGMSREMRRRSLRAEFACALRIPERTAKAQLVVSEALVHDLPKTLAALKAGEISYRHAQVMADQMVGSW